MVPSHFSGFVEKYEGRSGRSAIHIKIGFADWNRHIKQSTVEPMPHRIDVLNFIARTRVFDLRRVPVEPSWPNNLQSLSCKLRPQLRDDGRFRFAISAPVSPEEK